MRALVTGGAGFIGSHLCEALLLKGYEVIAVDDLSTGFRENIAHLEESNNFVFHEVEARRGFSHIQEKIDVVFHLAAKADIVPSITHPVRYHETNVNETIGMLEIAKTRAISKFVYAASSSCYGIPDIVPTPEWCECDPQYPYALTKYVGEQYVRHWAKLYRLPTISLRLFNVYGPRHRTSGAYGAVFGTFLSQLANGKPVTIVGDGEQTRDFTYVTDVVEAFIRAAESEESGEVYNVGSDGSYSVNYLTSLLGATSTVQIPKRPGEPDCTFADITKINTDLYWYPKVTFEMGVEKMKTLIPDYKDAPLWTPDTISVATKEWFEALS